MPRLLPPCQARNNCNILERQTSPVVRSWRAEGCSGWGSPAPSVSWNKIQMQFWLARVCRDPCNTGKPQLVAFLCIRVFMSFRLKMGMILHLLSLRSVKQLQNNTDLIICWARCVHTSDFYLSLKWAASEICSNKTMWLVCWRCLCCCQHSLDQSVHGFQTLRGVLLCLARGCWQWMVWGLWIAGWGISMDWARSSASSFCGVGARFSQQSTEEEMSGIDFKC